MKRFTVLLAFVVAVLLILPGCAAVNSIPKGEKGLWGAGVGTGAGAIIGQVIGRDTKATLIGAAIGGLVGYITGTEMDKRDLRCLNNVYEYGRSNQTVSWVNPDNSNRYRVTPQPAYRSSDRVCRRAKIIAVIDGTRQETYTMACRDEYGHWELQR